MRVINNVKASALLAVQQLGPKTECSHFYLRIAEGVGGTLVQQGKVVTGHSWTAGEAGHISSWQTRDEAPKVVDEVM